MSLSKVPVLGERAVNDAASDGDDDDMPSIDAECPIVSDTAQHLLSVAPLECAPCSVGHSEIRHCDDPHCTLYAVKVATTHGLALYPGAPAPAIMNDLPRTVGKTAEITATFLRSIDAVARPDGGLNTAKKGVKWLLKEKPALLLRYLNKILETAGEPPMGARHFYALVGTRWGRGGRSSCCDSMDIVDIVFLRHKITPPLFISDPSVPPTQRVRCSKDEQLLLCCLP